MLCVAATKFSMHALGMDIFEGWECRAELGDRVRVIQPAGIKDLLVRKSKSFAKVIKFAKLEGLESSRAGREFQVLRRVKLVAGEEDFFLPVTCFIDEGTVGKYICESCCCLF